MPDNDLIRDIRQQPFYWIEREFLPIYGSTIGPLGIAAYNALAYRASREGKAWPGLADLMTLTGIKSKTTLRRVLRDLEKVGVITIKPRYSGLVNESNEYYLLPLHADSPRSLNDPGRSGNDPGVGQEMTQVGQEMTQGRSGNDPEQHAVNNKHEQHAENNSKQACMPLPAAAADLLEEFSIDPTNLNGQGETLAAWLVYTKTQPGLKKPVGYAITQVRKGKNPDPVFTEIVNIDLPWPDLLVYAHYEKLYRDNPNVKGLTLVEDLEDISAEAINTLNTLWGTMP